MVGIGEDGRGGVVASDDDEAGAGVAIKDVIGSGLTGGGGMPGISGKTGISGLSGKSGQASPAELKNAYTQKNAGPLGLHDQRGPGF